MVDGVNLGNAVLDGGEGSDVLEVCYSNIADATFSGIEALNLSGSPVTLSAAQMASFNTIQGGGAIYAADAGTYDLSTKALSNYTYMLFGSSGNDTLIGNATTNTIWGQEGDDILIAGSGAATLMGGSGADTLCGGAGNDTLYGEMGNDTYAFGIGSGSDTIVENDSTPGNVDTVDFLSNLTKDNLWFTQVGYNLKVNILGTSDTLTARDWFYTTYGTIFQVESFTANGLTLDSQLAQLVSAMATYAANNPGFDPTTATSMPTDSALQTALAAAWHT